jgi:DNA-binding transcriptional LysR family regulator
MSTSPGRGGLLSAIRSRFTGLHPEATVELQQVTWDDPTAGFADGTVDVAFVWLPLPATNRSWSQKNSAGSPCPTATRWPAATSSTSPTC